MTIFTGEWRKKGDFFVLNIFSRSGFAGKPVNGVNT